MKENKICQSCSMPLSKDPKNGALEKDGSKNTEYCSYCYVDGRFYQEDTVNTPKKMQDMCIKMMKKDGMNGFVAWILTRTIPRLRRWKKK